MAPKSGSKSKPKTPQNPTLQHLVAGAKVEVMSDDEGFRGSFYSGTVIRRVSSKNPPKYLIEYDKLFADEEGTTNLRETLNVGQLRPAPPPEKKRRTFKFGDEVDAFHHDGWWEGVVTEEPKDGKFSVFFRCSREQIVFGEESLRVHREWADGTWKPPLEEEEEEDDVVEDKVEKEEQVSEEVSSTEVKRRKAMELEDVQPKKKHNKIEVGSNDRVTEKFPKATLIEKVGSNARVTEKFPKGMLVEVSSDEEGFKGAWFSATIAEILGNDRYLVQYLNIRNEDDTDFEKEEFDALHIRPCPPELNVVDRYKLLDEVDALYNDAWWVGVIVKVLSLKYVVFFKDTDEEIPFEHSDLRPHQDWIDGKWVLPSKDLKR